MARGIRPDVFIIESNELKDEKQGISEGVFLGQLLRMMGKAPEYRYIRTAKELEAMATEFAASGFRYLHMACHGTKSAFDLTLDKVPFADYTDVVGPVIGERRLFLSACSIAQPGLARAIYAKYRPYSITGPRTDIYFSDSAVVWASLYSLLFKDDPLAIRGEAIRKHLAALCGLHQVSFVHFGRTKSTPYFREYRFGK